MLLALDFSSDVPIYLQIRNQIVLGISQGKLLPGEKLPTIRCLASEIGVNTMTVNKAYQVLKQEGYITADRRSGAMVKVRESDTLGWKDKHIEDLRLVISEIKLCGIDKEELLKKCDLFYEEVSRHDC